MKQERGLVGIYSGTEASALLLKGQLDMAGISAEIRKESTAGTWGIVPDNIELFIEKSDIKEAQKIVKEFSDKVRIEKTGS